MLLVSELSIWPLLTKPRFPTCRCLPSHRRFSIPGRALTQTANLLLLCNIIPYLFLPCPLSIPTCYRIPIQPAVGIPTPPAVQLNLPSHSNPLSRSNSIRCPCQPALRLTLLFLPTGHRSTGCHVPTQFAVAWQSLAACQPAVGC